MSKNRLVKEYTFTMPLFIQLAKSVKGKKYHINLNNCLGWHHSTYASLKRKYTALCEEQLKKPKIKTPISIEYVLYRGDKRKIDLANVCSMHDKFFADALRSWGCIPEDSVVELPSITFTFGGYEKGKGRIEIIVREI